MQGSSPLLIITGPTASGKSAVGVEVARKISGQIISVDSAQVYRDFDIGTDKISASAQKGIPHHCIDFLSGDEQCNAFLWLKEAEKARQKIEANGDIPVFVGGTTLYIAALVEGLKELPAQNAELRAELDALSTSQLLARAERHDCSGAINPNDRLRLTRSIEIAESAVDQPRTAWPACREALIIVLLRDRQELYRKIDNRVKQMLNEGLVSEAQDLYTRFGSSQAFRSVGYSQCARYFSNDLEYEQLESEIAKASRRYAKRQLTFWRNEPVKRNWQQIPSAPAIPEKDHLVDRALTGRSMSLSSLIEQLNDRLREPFLQPEVWYVNLDSLSFPGQVE